MLRKIFSRTGERGFKKVIRFLTVVLVSFAMISVFMTNLVWSDPHSWQSILISESRFDRNHHDRNWKIEILFEQGERYIDNEPGAGTVKTGKAIFPFR